MRHLCVLRRTRKISTGAANKGTDHRNAQLAGHNHPPDDIGKQQQGRGGK